MKKKYRLCSDCGTRTEFRPVEQEYERRGVRVRIQGIPAMVCPHCGSISFPPGVAQQIVTVANTMFDMVKGRHRGVLVVDARK